MTHTPPREAPSSPSQRSADRHPAKAKDLYVVRDYDWIVCEAEAPIRHYVVTEPSGLGEDDDGADSQWERHLLWIRWKERVRVGRSHGRWTRSPAEKVGHHNSRAYARGALATLTTTEWERLREAFGGACAYCSRPGVIHLEHVVPISRGGDTSIWNVVPACEGCNMGKRGRDLLEWIRPERVVALFERCIEATKNPAD